MHFINVVPFIPNDPGYMAQQARRIFADVGLNTVAFSLSLHPEGTPAKKKAVLYSDAFTVLKKELENDPEIRPGILLQSLLGHGWSGLVKLTEEPWQNTVKTDGTESSRLCPLGRDFRDYVLHAIEGLAASSPAFFLVDDDFCNKRGECFCPLHMAEYSKRTGREWTREELVAHLEAGAPSDSVVQAVNAVVNDGLVSFAEEIRGTINKENSTIRCGMCCPGVGQYNLAGVTRALAGETEPFIRLAGAIYSGQDPLALNWVSRATAIRRFASDGIRDLIAESDTFPHNRYSVSAVALHAHITLGILNGLNGSKLWNTIFYDKDPESGSRYEKIVAKNLRFYDGLLNLVDAAEWQGPETPISDHRRDYHVLDPGRPLEFPDFHTALLGRFGIPTRYGNTFEKRLRTLSGNHVDRFTDGELEKFFQGGLLLDGLAATELARRGFTELMGVSIGSQKDFFHNKEVYLSTGKIAPYTWQTGGAQLIPIEGAREVTTLFYEPIGFVDERTRQGSGMVFFENSLGGRVATIACHTGMPYHTMLLPVRRRFLIEALDFLAEGMMPIVLEEAQDVLARHALLKDGSELLVVINLSTDPLESLQVRSSRSLKSVQRFGSDGSWTEQSFEQMDRTHFCLPQVLGMLEIGVFECRFQSVAMEELEIRDSEHSSGLYGEANHD